MPNASGPLSASPESLTITRRYLGTATPPERGRPARSFVGRAGCPRSRCASGLARGSRHLGREIRVMAVDAFTERIAHEARHPDGAADPAFGILQRLGDGLA